MARQGKTRQPAKSGSRGAGGGSGASAPTAGAPRRKTMNPLKFFSEVRQEGRRVTWTSRRETLISTLMVAIMAAFAALFFFVVDSLINVTIDFLLGLGA